MSDNVRRFRSILKSLKKLYPKEPKGNLIRNLVTMAFMISGIILIIVGLVGDKIYLLPIGLALVALSLGIWQKSRKIQ